MSSLVHLLGLDIGSTTTHLLIAEAQLLKNCVTGRLEFDSPKVCYRSEPIFTPFQNHEIDLEKLSMQISAWLKQSKIKNSELTAGGAIVTGLASKKENAQKIKQLVKKLVSDSMVATAEDPHLESWLAFKGNCASLCDKNPSQTFLNLDIGGGTTNLAIGRAGQVMSTGCLFIGARHLLFEAGSYKLINLSDYGKRLLTHLKIPKEPGEIFSHEEVQKVTGFYVRTLEEVVSDSHEKDYEELFDYTDDQKLKLPPKDAKITFSGGVGELIYRFSRGEKPQGISQYGDLGEALALAILNSKILSKDLKTTVPSELGRATVFGMTLHQVDVSGLTTFLSKPSLLPCEDIPIVTLVDFNSSQEELSSQIESLGSTGKKAGAFVRFRPGDIRAQMITFAEKLADVPTGICLVLFVEGNQGKTLGNYLTDWGKRAFDCIVVDEVPLKQAQFASLGRMLQNTIPVSFYGMR